MMETGLAESFAAQVPELPGLLDELLKCSRCGRCQAVCPVYLATGKERLVARGKLALILAASEGELDPTPSFVDTISRCLLCGACRDFCARGVPTDDIIRKVRALSARKLGLPRYYQLLVGGLTRPRLLSWVTRAGALGQSLLSVLPDAPLSLVPWLGKYASGSSLRLASRPFLSEKGSGRGQEGVEQKAGSVGLFVGCGANYLYPEAARAAEKLLAGAGVRVVAPSLQVCCGMPASSAGDEASMMELARRNAEALAGLSAVVTPCASCAHQLRTYASLGIDLPPVHLLTEFLAANPPVVRAASKTRRVAYHAPCHLRFARSGLAETHALLEAAPGIELVPVEPGCCGFGGLFALAHPNLAAEIGAERVRVLLRERPDIIATDCSGCIIHLRQALARLKAKVPVVSSGVLLAGS
jgi:glycolate oxidase iron-sulfur subunit